MTIFRIMAIFGGVWFGVLVPFHGGDDAIAFSLPANAKNNQSISANIRHAPEAALLLQVCEAGPVAQDRSGENPPRQEHGVFATVSPFKNFWLVPPGGSSDTTKGLSDEQLQRWEEKTGFSLPLLYKEQMKRQNGGVPRRGGYPMADGVFVLFFDYAPRPYQIAPIATDDAYIPLMDRIIGLDGGKMASFLASAPHPERLYPLSMDEAGPVVLALDYGLREEVRRTEPEVVLLGRAGNGVYKEMFRVPSYRQFVENLVPLNEPSFDFYFGVRTDKTLSEAAQHLSLALARSYDHDNQGTFNFESGDSAIVTLEGERYEITLSPNQFHSGEWMFPDDKDVPLIVEISAQSSDKAALGRLVGMFEGDDVKIEALFP